MSARILLAAALPVFLLAGPASATFVLLDDFNRDDGPIGGGDGWTQHTGSELRFVVNGQEAVATGSEQAFMTHGTYAGAGVRFDLHHSGGTGLEYVAGVVGFGDVDNYVMVKLTSNAGSADFSLITLHFVENGQMHNGWDGMTNGSYFMVLSESQQFTDAQVTITREGDQLDRVRVAIDTDFSDATPADLVIARGNLPTALLGEGVGAAALGDAAIDDFGGMPEPATLLMLFGGAAALVLHRGRGRSLPG